MEQTASRLGEPLDRVDGPLKVTGRATYAYEQQVPGAVVAVLVVSPIAKGRITSIDTANAARQPGVLHVMTHENAPKLPAPEEKRDQPPGPGEAWQALQSDRIYYAYQPVAVVIAHSSVEAQAAAKLVEVRYAIETPENDLDSRLSEAYTPKKAGGGGDPASSARGDFDTALQSAPSKIDQVYRTPFQFHNPMEPHATVAQWTAPDALTVYDATQGVFGTAGRIAKALALKPENVRVISPYLGGGFGSKGPTWSHVIIAALAAKQVRRPVRLEVARPQMFNMVGLRSETRQHIRIAADEWDDSRHRQ